MILKRLQALGRHVASHEDALLEGALPNAAMRADLAARAVARNRGQSRPLTWRRAIALAGAAVAAAGVALAVSSVLLTSDPPLTFTVGDPERPGVLREWVSATQQAPMMLRFSDGGRVALEPDARARVVQVSPRGAEVVVESGRAMVSIRPDQGSDWRIRTGPFVVHVTGTRFQVGWSPQTDQLDVKLYEGSVVVSGCTLGDGHRLEVGQRLQASCDGRRLVVQPLEQKTEEATAPTSAAAEDPASHAAADSDAEPPEPIGGQPASPRPAGHPSPRASESAPAGTLDTPRSWTALARQGHYRQAYQAAKAAGFRRQCHSRGAEDVALLGDAARLAGAAGDANYAYETVRARFPGSAAAARAAFNLGQLDSRAGRESAASDWYRRSVAEQPSGSLSAAALGRLLESRIKLGDLAGAREVARSYLKRYPTGGHADEARKVLQSTPRGK